MKRKYYDLFVMHNLHFFCFSYLWSRLWKWRSMCWPQPVCMPLWFSRPTVSRRHWWMFHGAQCAQMFLRFHMCQQARMVSSIQSTIGPLILRFKYCDLPRFFDHVGHQTTNASIGNKHFFTKWGHRQTYQNYEQPCQRSQNFEFQSHFSVSKIGRIFPKKNFCEEYLIRRPTYINEIFWKLWFLKYFIF